MRPLLEALARMPFLEARNGRGTMPIDYLFVHNWLWLGAVAIPFLLIVAWLSKFAGKRKRTKLSKRPPPYM
jgi:hypothetical protein